MKLQSILMMFQIKLTNNISILFIFIEFAYNFFFYQIFFENFVHAIKH